MKRLLLVLALLAIPAAAAAAPIVQQSDYTVCSITTTAATSCSIPGGLGPATYLVGVTNNALTAQTVTVTCFDNATAASGTVAASIGALGITQIITWPAPGRPLLLGLTCQASGTPIAPGIEIYAR